VEREGGNLAGRAALNLLAPWNQSSERGTAETNELLRVAQSTGDNSALLRYAPDAISNNGVSYPLTEDMRREYQKTYGDTVQATVSQIMALPEYQNATDAEKQEYLSVVEDYAAEIAAANLVQQSGGEYKFDKWVSVARTSQETMKIPTAEFLALRAEYREHADNLSNDNFVKAVSAGIPARAYMDYCVKRSNLKPTDGLKSVSVTQKAELLVSQPGLSEQQKIFLIGQISESRGEDAQTLSEYGISSKQFADIWSEYTKIDRRDELKPKDKAVEFSKWLNTQTYSPEQKRAIRENFPYTFGGIVEYNMGFSLSLPEIKLPELKLPELKLPTLR